MIARPRVAVLVATASSVLLTAGIPTATARSDREHAGSKSTAPGSHEAAAAAPSETPSADTQTPAGASSPPGTAPSTSERHSKHSTSAPSAKHGGEASTGSTTTSSTSRPTTTSTPGPATRHGGSAGAGHRQDSGRGGGGQSGDRSSGTPSAQGVSSGTPAKTGTGSKTSTGPGGEAGGTAEGRRKQERSGKPKGSHVAQGKANKVESARPATLPSEPPSVASPSSSPLAAPALAAPATVAPVATAATTVAKSPVLAAGSAPAVARRFAQRFGAGKAPSQRRAGARRTGQGASAPIASAAIAGTASTAATATTTSSAHPKATAKPAARTRSSSPLTSTITRIVDVVPTPIRVLIAALVALALAMAARTQLAGRRARRLEQQRSELLEDVGLLQAALLPDTPPRLGPVGTSTAYRPAAGPAAGGDFYDVFALEDGKLAVILGDVSGHGRKALPHTALVRFTLRAYLEAGLSPRGAVQTAGSVLERQLGGSFATVVAATYNPRERLLVYASAGHPPPLVRGREPGSKPLEPITASSSPPIGVGIATGIRQSVIAVPGAAQICFFTDGVTEARVGGDLYGIQRLDAALLAIGEQGTAAELLDRVAQTSDRRPDDMAACLLHVEGSSEAPVAVLEELELSREECASKRPEQFLAACGVAAEEAARLMRSARAAAEGSGSVVLELRRSTGAPEVSLQQDNLAYLQTRHAARQADLRMSI